VAAASELMLWPAIAARIDRAVVDVMVGVTLSPEMAASIALAVVAEIFGVTLAPMMAARSSRVAPASLGIFQTLDGRI